VSKRAYPVSGLDSETGSEKIIPYSTFQLTESGSHNTHTASKEVNKRKERERQELRQEGEEAKRAKLTDTL
jgi:hypothetical protein